MTQLFYKVSDRDFMIKVMRVLWPGSIFREGGKRQKKKLKKLGKNALKVASQVSLKAQGKIMGKEVLRLYRGTKAQGGKMHKQIIGKKGILFNKKQS